MAGSVARLPDPPGGGVPPGDLLKLAVDEYRFQAQFNWSRTQYLLAFNAAILTAGSAVAATPGKAAALVYLLGVAVAGLSVVAVRTQHDYYRAARDRMRRVEASVGVPHESRVDTTSTLGDRTRRVSVNQVVYLILSAVVIADVVGMAVILRTR
jgi:hypothetical protein